MITSKANQKIRTLKNLQTKKHRTLAQQFYVEGVREFERACSAGFTPLAIYLCPKLFKGKLPAHEKLIETVSEEVYASLAVRENANGLIAVFASRFRKLEDLTLKPNEKTLLIICDALEKPGNLGAILRTADGVGARALLLPQESFDLYNPNIVRASIGSVFHLPVYLASAKKIVSFLNQNQFATFGLEPEAKTSYTEIAFPRQTALILGAEDRGIQYPWSKELKEFSAIKIPMAGVSDSLNVSVAAAVVLYEVRRQHSVATSS